MYTVVHLTTCHELEGRKKSHVRSLDSAHQDIPLVDLRPDSGLPTRSLRLRAPVGQQTMATTTTASPLPALDSWIKKLRLCDRYNRFSAYNMILRAEQYAVQQQAEGDIVTARTVGYFLLEFDAQYGAFGDGPCASIVKQVASLPQTPGAKNRMNAMLSSMPGNCVAINYSACVRLIGFTTPPDILSYFEVRTSTEPYPPPSSHPSRPSFDTLEAMIMVSMKATGKDYKTSRRWVPMFPLRSSLPCSRPTRRSFATDIGVW